MSEQRTSKPTSKCLVCSSCGVSTDDINELTGQIDKLRADLKLEREQFDIQVTEYRGLQAERDRLRAQIRYWADMGFLRASRPVK